ncbi:hypothetical protein N1851_024035 [Merluccius polli]|uniref:Gypsy retrotransposon integrase-like protein 1 n=2 Tax=Merluccius polli TaxID=89951 RepID=A0AA47MFS5_MERPO|nr:hypothetical protein N1851_024035 [Merluccius polli]
MATAMVGTLTAFDSQTQTWEEYVEVLGHFFVANGIADEGKKRAILLSSVGSRTYSLMRNLLSPNKPGEKSYEDLTALLQSHYNPKPSEIVQRFKFNSRVRATTETVTEYVAVLRELAQHCNYGDKLKEMLRDRLVCGVADDRMQRRLLAEPELTFERALKVALAMETATRDVRDLQLKTLDGTVSKAAPQLLVHNVESNHKGQGKATPLTCYRCGGEHMAKDCRFINEKCHACGKKGHVKRVCKSSPSAGHQLRGEGKHKQFGKSFRNDKKQSAHHISEFPESVTSDEGEVFTIYKLTEPKITKVDPITAQLNLNKNIVTFEVDTGCSVTILSKTEYAKLQTAGGTQELQDCSVTLKTYTGEKVPTLGAADVTVRYKGQVKQLPVVVVAGPGPNLLGRAWIKALGMNCVLIHKMEQQELTLQYVLQQKEEVFKEELGTWRGPPAKIYVTEGVAPKFYKPRPVPYAMRKKVNRLPFGVSSSPAIFQRMMESLVAGIPNVAVYLDDILLTGQTEMSRWTSRDPVLSRVTQFVHHGWPPQDRDPAFQPYAVRKTELSVQDGCVLWGSRVVVPPLGRDALLQQLHHGHIGITRMKALARSYFWWPGLDADIEAVVKRCVACQEHRNSPAPAPLHPWEWPSKPWQRIHIDYAGPFMGHMFLIVMDAHSKWMDVYPVTTSTSASTIECLRKSFSNQGLPETVVSDNGSCFVSAEFREFMQKNGIEHITSAPYHASSNGCAERAVQTFKSMMKKAGDGSLTTKVSRVLFSYRITPQSTTGLSPAELLQGRKLRSTLDLIHPDRRMKVERKQSIQKKHHDKQVSGRSFREGDAVITRNFSHGPKWIPGFITKITGPVSYKVMLGDGSIVRRHVDQILARSEDKDLGEPAIMETRGPSESPAAAMAASESSIPEGNRGVPEVNTQEMAEPTSGKANPSVRDIQPPEAPMQSRSSTTPARRSVRPASKPSYLKDYEC